ncbi:hypothetical protein AA12717_3428 [Gluconacetobacter sacchari DSM 12717]|uniref:Uncharacterized protein n=2 Tax=Gluconacetobacter sacchari TaxID=92759 RepID=A0A7W4IHB2_9PROT|nr:hypothetical protein [Gluconacetobacter sacchari]MBB2162850.1 hypothetical protein [Gluconacetobacter sacchari]GBQ30069.1 hypothetical protein AA12717_3428 [Gluconacetobacter sacchari DSM 12717]
MEEKNEDLYSPSAQPVEDDAGDGFVAGQASKSEVANTADNLEKVVQLLGDNARNQHSPMFGQSRAWTWVFTIFVVMSTIGPIIAAILSVYNSHIYVAEFFVSVYFIGVVGIPGTVFSMILSGLVKEGRDQIKNILNAAKNEAEKDKEIERELKKCDINSLLMLRDAYLRNYNSYKSQYDFMSIGAAIPLAGAIFAHWSAPLSNIIPNEKIVHYILWAVGIGMVSIAAVCQIMKASLRLKGGQHERILAIFESILGPISNRKKVGKPKKPIRESTL